MLVRQILEETESFPTIVTDVTVRDAAKVMSEADVRAVPVVEGDTLGDKPVSAIMTTEKLVTIQASSTAAYATAKLQEKRVHHLPVLDDERYVGMICLGTEWSDESMLQPPTRPTLTARRP